MSLKEGFVNIRVNVKRLAEENIPFALWLELDFNENPTIKGALVTRENWTKVESSLNNDIFSFTGNTPLLSINENLYLIIKELNGIVVGEA